MKTAGTRPSSELRTHARRLLKQLKHPTGAAEALAAAERFRRLRSFADRSRQKLWAERDRVRLKHALAVVALENGYDSWPALKTAADEGRTPPFAAVVPPGREWYESGMDVLLNRWFATYEAARASLEEEGGFLFPYAHQFFLCEAEGIRILGLDPDDPDWERIGRNAVEPADAAAWERLREKRARVLLRRA